MAGAHLLQPLLAPASIALLEGTVLASNAPMLALMRARLYECHSIPGDATVIRVSTTLPRKDTP